MDNLKLGLASLLDWLALRKGLVVLLCLRNALSPHIMPSIGSEFPVCFTKASEGGIKLSGIWSEPNKRSLWGTKSSRESRWCTSRGTVQVVGIQTPSTHCKTLYPLHATRCQAFCELLWTRLSFTLPQSLSSESSEKLDETASVLRVCVNPTLMQGGFGGVIKLHSPSAPYTGGFPSN